MLDFSSLFKEMERIYLNFNANIQREVKVYVD